MNDVLIIEDHPIVADDTQEIVSRYYPNLNITIRASAEAALDALADTSKTWHRILLDLGVPGAHGLSLAKKIRDQGFGPITCVVTGHERCDFVDQVRAMGFLGYIAKSSPMEQLSSALVMVFSGERFFPPSSKEKAQQLTKKQLEILSYVRDGLSSKLIAAKLNLKVGTVNNHIDNAIGALGALSRTHAVAKAIELGLLDIESDAGAFRGSRGVI